MKTVFYPVFILIICSFGFTSCGGDDDGPGGCSVNWAFELQDELTAISNAAAAHNNDPSPATCDALKSAYLAYINKLKPYGNCSGLSGQDRASWEQAVEDAEDDVDTIC
jgi:hypothetical protein